MRHLNQVLNLFQKTFNISTLDIELGTSTDVIKEKVQTLLSKKNIRLDLVAESFAKDDERVTKQREEDALLSDLQFIYQLLSVEFTDCSISNKPTSINLEAENFLGFKKESLLYSLYNIGVGQTQSEGAKEAFEVLEQAQKTIPKSDLKTVLYLMCCTNKLGLNKLTSVLAFLLFRGGENYDE